MIVSAAGVLRAAPKREGTSNKLNWLGKKFVVLSNSLEMPNHAFGTRGMRGYVSARTVTVWLETLHNSVLSAISYHFMQVNVYNCC